MNFGQLIWRAVRLFPERVAIEQGGRKLTFADVDRRANQVANLLASRGVGHGQRVLLMLPNDARFAECLLGVLRLGAVAVPANVKLGRETLAYIAEHSDSVAMIAHAELSEKLPTIGTTLVMGEQHDAYELALAAQPSQFATLEVEPGDVAVQMYTSGSTGLPKGCLLSHATEWWQARSVASCMFLDERDAVLITGPLYHANALWAGMFPMLLSGGRMSVLAGFEPRAVLEQIHTFKPTYLTGTPTMYALLLAEHDRMPLIDVSSITLLMCGSAPVPAELMAALQRRFPGVQVVESFGLTEAGANVLSPRWGIKKEGSCGLPVPDVELRVVDDATQDCAPGQVGELWTRSPANTLGYYKQPDVTAEKITRAGWLKSGDLVHRDEQGYVYFRGRKDDMISVGGENVYPKEIESILLQHRDVADVCVVPVRHATKGQAPVAWVVPRQRTHPSEAELQRYFLERGPAYAHPRRVFFLEALPVSGTNKVERKYLEAEANQRLPNGLESRGATQPGLTVAPARSMVDEPLCLSVSGLSVGQHVTLRSRQVDEHGRLWSAHAEFEADASGSVDVASQAPVAGTYDVADPMGLIWSMELPAEEPNRAPAFRSQPTPLTIDVTAEVDGHAVARQSVERLYVADGVERIAVRDDGLVATLFVPPGRGPHPVVISLSGSGGGLFEGGAALYASRGYAGMALAYFNAETLPSDLVTIPLEYFETAFAWLSRQPRIDGDRIAVSGSSRGGELALLLGATFPVVKGVIGYVPSGVVHGGITRSGVRGQHPAWTFRGQPVTWLQPRPELLSPELPPAVEGQAIPLTPRFRRMLEDQQAAARAEIPVERINGPVLLISGKDDAMWPSEELADIAMRRLARHGFRHSYTHLVYPDAGHLISAPYGPCTILASRHALTGQYFAYGGTPRGYAVAREDSWRHVLQTLDEAFASRAAAPVSP